ncbi:MAG: 30S ribosomal protein S6 [Deltaproteobacteria bacterium HGW-Deltaproteobacteria-14]|jgi:small subunit ribosomal protein S6|nr:MAG: 30S ribosomal protein S6 [Deltaproteobacteria bacterium HGW-Deltaproteobacteria-14]
MLTRKYEVVVLVHPDAGEEGNEKVLARIREALAKTGGTEIRLEDWGVRRLAYELGGQRKAQYHYMLYLGTNTTVAEMERLLGITETILKYQTILLEDRVESDTFDFETASGEVTSLGRSVQKEAIA